MKWCLEPLRKYAVFSGRARRKEYWIYILVFGIIAFPLGLIDALIGTYPLIGLLFSLAFFIPTLAVMVRRLHDTGRSGWWWFIQLVPIIGSIIFLVFMVLDSQAGDNEYGPNPKTDPV